ncbi:MAG: transcription-repair coupling factor [Prevotella sp.]|jgi:transcription-repair coupling factor (superfamily II helicase)|nr:transcription-repair coupling factor [Prevotella sp.]
MKIQDINCLYGASPQAGALLKILENKSVNRVFLQGLLASSVPMLFASVASRLKQTFLFVLSDADEGGYFYHDLVQLMGQETVFYFPSSYRRAVKYGQRDAANEILRTEVLSKIDFGKCLYIVTSPDALSELVVSKSSLDNRLLKLKTGQNIDITDVEKTLREFGFEEVDYVYEPGQFAVRGSILDVFSFSCEYPFRIDFFGDEIDTIRTFEVQDQLSQDKRIEIEIVPELAAMKENKVPFLDFLPDDTVLVMKDFAYVRDSIDKIYREGFSRQAMTEQLEGVTEVEKAEILLNLQKERNLCTGSQFSEETARFKWVEFGPQPNSAILAYDKEAILKFNITPQPLFHKNFDLLKHSLEDYLQQGYKLYILADSQKQQQRLRDIFDEMGADRERSGYDSQRSGIQFTSVDKTLHEGFADNDLKLCFFTDHQIFDRFHKYSLRSDSARAGKMALTMKELQEMDPGDFIVHIDFGIGKFGGLVRVPTPDGGYQEVIRIIYQNNDKVDVSIHSLYKISKYRRQDTGEPPRLSTLGTGAWDRLKERTKAKIKDIARDLIRLYAKRRHEKGFPYSTDSYMQHELEASFLYEDTPDQLKATQDVKADMEMAKPMDRLVCGDVGFGKTEVAVRAAFKAACDSKQVAVLVPTTVLAFQHYQTFRDRLKDFPVRVDYLTRARSAKQTRQILDDLASGKIDIIIGTHKLLGKQLKWHDLGLLIIDEEQKFGVSTKEKLRKLKTNVDTLTMSATPIPRTLQFSLMGARDMSIIRTPPPNRYPIQTELTTYGHEVIADAINFEMSRNGQVFFVNNRISNLPEIEQLIHKYVPDCRVVIGHGQMEPEELEKRIMGFINYDYDVLLSTTIVENGIDIPNANTIIINDAHRFGLSDLHQMRGRVGRSNRKAFCYLLAPPKSVLTPEARRRLEALENFSELGSGFNLAMQDLDIRGAGNLLGAEQSGFMEDLGYETYQKILSQAVTELKNDEFQDIYADEIAHGRQVNGDEFVEDCAIESDLEMYFPDTYVPGSSERMLLYRELDNINDDAALEAYRKRLIDRFGPVPREGEELMQVVSLRRLGKSLGCEKILLRQSRMTLQFVSNSESAYYQSQAFGKVLDYLAANPRRCNLTEIKGRRLMRMADVKTVEEAVEILKAIKA